MNMNNMISFRKIIAIPNIKIITIWNLRRKLRPHDTILIEYRKVFNGKTHYYFKEEYIDLN